MKDEMARTMFFEGLTLTVKDVGRSIEFYAGKLGLTVEHNASPAFALIRAGGVESGTIGLLCFDEARKAGSDESSPRQERSVHVEFSTDDLDALFEELKARGVTFIEPPHDEPWERSMTALDPDGYSVEFAQGRRGRNAPQANDT